MAKVALWDTFWLELDATSRATIVGTLLFFWVLFNSSVVYYYLGPTLVQQVNRFKLLVLNIISAVITTFLVSEMPTPIPDNKLQPRVWKSGIGLTSFFRNIVAKSLDEIFRLSWASLVKLLSIWFIIFVILMILFSFIFYLRSEAKLRKSLAISQIFLAIIIIFVLHFSMICLC